MNKYSNVLLSVILALVLLNLALTGSLLIKQTAQPIVVNQTERAPDSLDPAIAKAWGEKVTTMYNEQDHQALYALFSEQAKVKISHQQLESQLQKLFNLFGNIEKSALVSADKVAEKGGELYYQLLFNIRVKEASKRLGTLTISVVKNDRKVSLYGVRINASQSLD